MDTLLATENRLLVRENPCMLELCPGTPSRFYYVGSKTKLREEVKQVTSELWNLLGARCHVSGKSKGPPKTVEITLVGRISQAVPHLRLQGDGQVTFISELHLLLIK